jgi:hypothetical protein
MRFYKAFVFIMFVLLIITIVPTRYHRFFSLFSETPFQKATPPFRDTIQRPIMKDIVTGPITCKKSPLKQDADSRVLDELYARLDNPQNENCCLDIIHDIVKYKGNAKSVKALKRFIMRKERFVTTKTWSHKRKTLENIGRIGGPEACSVLREAFSDSGAHELTNNWINERIPEDDKTSIDRGWLIAEFRGAAARGLVNAHDEIGLRDVAREYERMAKEMKGDPRSHKKYLEVKYTDQEEQRNNLFNSLVDALALRDCIAERGEAFLEQEQTYVIATLEPYWRKYWQPHEGR